MNQISIKAIQKIKVGKQGGRQTPQLPIPYDKQNQVETHEHCVKPGQVIVRLERVAL